MNYYRPQSNSETSLAFCNFQFLKWIGFMSVSSTTNIKSLRVKLQEFFIFNDWTTILKDRIYMREVKCSHASMAYNFQRSQLNQLPHDEKYYGLSVDSFAIKSIGGNYNYCAPWKCLSDETVVPLYAFKKILLWFCFHALTYCFLSMNLHKIFVSLALGPAEISHGGAILRSFVI